MAGSLSTRCSCGEVRGRILDANSALGIRLVCHCDDCQAYAHWLGRSEQVLDEWGGTEVYQTGPAQVRIDEGSENLACARLYPKGLRRWYAACCRTPIANTLDSPRIPFAGVHAVFVEPDVGEVERDERLGPVLARVNGRFGMGTLPEGSHARAPAWLIARSLRRLGSAWIRGDHRPSPFFDEAGHPRGETTVVEQIERERLRSLCGPG